MTSKSYIKPIVWETNKQGMQMFSIGISWYIGKILNENSRIVRHTGQRQYIQRVWKQSYKLF